MAEIGLSAEELRAIYTEMIGTTEQLRNAAEGMMASVERLTGMWTGPAHDAFYNEFLIHKEVMDNYIETCENVSQCVDSSINDYYDAEAAIEEAVSSISG